VRANLAHSMKLPRESSSPGHRTGRPTVRAWPTLLFLVGFAAACAKPAVGPPFEIAPPPPDYRGRVYLYRADQPGSLAAVRITIDRQDVSGRIRNGEYETLELPTGTHRLRAGLRGFGLLAWGWNNHQFRLGPGETIYIKLSVQLTAQPAPTARGVEIAGRPSGTASENVFIIRQSADDALSGLKSTTRMVRPESTTD